MEEPLLMIPGPTNLSESVREVMSRPQIGHVSPVFYEQFKEILVLARHVFRNEKGFQYVFTGTGTTAMEATVVSTVTPGDKTLVLDTGYFGRRFALLNETHGARVESIKYGPGKAANPDDLRRKLRTDEFEAVFMTHVETSTGVRNPIKELVEECQKAGVFSIIDSVCGIGGAELDFDKIGADSVFAASQKALAAPPGATLIAVSNELLRHFEKRKTPIASYYMNLLRWKPIMDDPKIYLATPAVQVLLALRQALLEIKQEGLQNRWERHQKIGQIFQDGVKEMGAEIVTDEGFRAETVTGFWVNEGLAPRVQQLLRERHRIEVAKGLLENNQKMIRVGHFGTLTLEQLRGVIAALSQVLAELGATTRPKQSIQVAGRNQTRGK